MPYYEMRFTLGEKISDLAQATLGRRPVVVGCGGGGSIIQIEFSPDLTSAERTAMLNAMPEWVRKLYTFIRETGTLVSPL